MLARILCVLLAVSVGVTSLPPPADAQFGIRRAFKKCRSSARPGSCRRAGAVAVAAPASYSADRSASAFGVVAAVAVGAVIFDRLSKPERREVARRAKVVVAKDPEQRVADTYTSKDGTKQVTITAEPMQKAADLKNDPAIIVTADKVVAPDGTAGPAAPGPRSRPIPPRRPMHRHRLQRFRQTARPPRPRPSRRSTRRSCGSPKFRPRRSAGR